MGNVTGQIMTQGSIVAPVTTGIFAQGVDGYGNVPENDVNHHQGDFDSVELINLEKLVLNINSPAKIGTYAGVTLANGISSFDDVNIPGVLASKNNVVSYTVGALDTLVNIHMSVVADDTVRVYIINESGKVITIPTTEIRVKQL